MAYSLTDMSGAIILSWAQMPAIGPYTEAGIDAEIATRDSASIAGTAIAQIETAAAGLGIDLDSLSTEETACVNAAILFYVVGKYYETARKTGQVPCCDECEDKENPHVWYICRACEKLGEYSTSLQAAVGFCDVVFKNEIPADFFSDTVLIDNCGCVVQ